MKDIIKQTAWQFKIFHENNLVIISLVMTAMYTGIFFLIRDLENLDKFLTLLIYNDPAIIGLLFVGLAIIIEKNQGVISALFTTPMNLHTYLISKILALSIIGWLCALGMAWAAVGFTFKLLHFSMGCVDDLCIVQFSWTNSSSPYYPVFTLYDSVHTLTAFFQSSLIELFQPNRYTYFQNNSYSRWFEFDRTFFEYSMSQPQIIISYTSMLFWLGALYFLAFRIFKKRIN